MTPLQAPYISVHGFNICKSRRNVLPLKSSGARGFQRRDLAVGYMQMNILILTTFTLFLGSFSDSLSYAKFKAKWKNDCDNKVVGTRKIFKSYGFSYYTHIFKSSITILYMWPRI